MSNLITDGSPLIENVSHAYNTKKPSKEEIEERAKAIKASASTYSAFFELISDKSMPMDCPDGVTRKKFRQKYYTSDGIWTVDGNEVM